MKLIRVNVQRYRSVGESTEFDVEPDVTVLVGKNESGKTAVLQSLYKSFPIDAAKFDPDLDYPSHLTRELVGKNPIQVTELTYELDEDDVSAVEDVLCPSVLQSERIIITTGYFYDRPKWSISLDLEKFVTSLKNSLDLPEEDKKKTDSASTVSDLIAVLEEMETTTRSSDDLLKRFQAWSKPDPVQAAVDVLDERLPRFVYFGDYDIMPGKVSIPRLIERRRSSTLERGQEALLALLEIAGVQIDDLNTPENHEHLIRQMENASNAISDEVFEYWSQNKELQVELKDIPKAENGAESPLDQAPLLQVRVRNLHHRVTVPFDERSRGFVWFFSFLAYFSKVEQESSSPIILLLDEPGLSLHATAQHDLLRFINDRLASRHQVIFTTHSPFMIDPHHFERVRTVIDDHSTGTTVSSDVLKTDVDSAFPLHAALGMELTQTLFVGPDVLLVEGPSDVVYLQYLSDQLVKNGKAGLNERWVLVPGGGIAKLPAFLALFGANKMKVAVLSDSSVDNERIIKSLHVNSRLYNGGIVQIGDVLDRAEADIEDLLPEKFYVELVNDAYQGLLSGCPLDLEKLPDGSRIVKRVEQAFNELNINNGRLNHYSPAGALLRKKDVKSLSEEELSAASELISKINALLNQ